MVLDKAYFTILAAAFLIASGSMAMPALVWLVRACRPFALRLAWRAARTAAASALGRAIRWFIAIATASAALLLALSFIQATPASAQTATGSSAETTSAALVSADLAIPELMARIRVGKALPRWALRAAERAFDVWRAYLNDKRVAAVEKQAAEVAQEVRAILTIIADLQAEAEAGRAMNDREFRLTHDLVEAHAQRLEDLAIRIHGLEVRVAELEGQASADRAENAEQRRQLDKARGEIGNLNKRIRRNGCGVGRASRDGKCVDVAENPR